MSNFTRVSEMNTAFGKPKGNPKSIEWDRIRSQCLNIADELGELFVALGANKANTEFAVGNLKAIATDIREDVDVDGVRDALCDVHVFAYGAHHLMGIDADVDMDTVVTSIFSRFIKDEADLMTTVNMHAAKGVTTISFGGTYPKMVMYSAKDQPDAPKGKFLKSASYKQPSFYSID